jgi:integrase
MLLSDAIERYSAEHTRPGQELWSAKTVEENSSIFDLFLRIIGDSPVKDITRATINEYRDTLLRLPPNLNRDKRYQGKSIDDLLADSSVKPMATNTVNKNLTRIASLFRWLYRHGHVAMNPAENLTVRKKVRPDQERPAFTAEELRRIFAPREYRYPYQRWLPLIALYTGARLEEICQAKLDDFKEVDGVMVLHIHTGEGRKVKTMSGDRMIPLHSALLNAGLLEYIEEKRAEGAPRLFPELSKGRDGYGQTASKWFSRLRLQVGVEGVFHSFRHTVATALKEADVPEHAIAQVLGHAHRQISTGRYGKRHDPKKLQRWVEMLDFKLTTGGTGGAS